jgi:hypothetical protein
LDKNVIWSKKKASTHLFIKYVEYLIQVIKVITEIKLYLNQNKYKFGYTQIKFMENVINKESFIINYLEIYNI